MPQQSERTVTAVFTEWQSSRLKTSSGHFSTPESEDEEAAHRRLLEFEAVELPASDALDVYRQIVMALTDALGEGDAGQPEAALYRRALSALGIASQV
ncbi:hypothetical protein [Cypionkella sinensis]|uniref:Uncharacterized protein n=1 Tax=Cypionkella sinensis TaxID=1756043 RepID=A0ABV7J2C0_9RHOB